MSNYKQLEKPVIFKKGKTYLGIINKKTDEFYLNTVKVEDINLEGYKVIDIEEGIIIFDNPFIELYVETDFGLYIVEDDTGNSKKYNKDEACYPEIESIVKLKTRIEKVDIVYSNNNKTFQICELYDVYKNKYIAIKSNCKITNIDISYYLKKVKMLNLSENNRYVYF